MKDVGKRIALHFISCCLLQYLRLYNRRPICLQCDELIGNTYIYIYTHTHTHTHTHIHTFISHSVPVSVYKTVNEPIQ